jgi:hypothetical protein
LGIGDWEKKRSKDETQRHSAIKRHCIGAKVREEKGERKGLGIFWAKLFITIH